MQSCTSFGHSPSLGGICSCSMTGHECACASQASRQHACFTWRATCTEHEARAFPCMLRWNSETIWSLKSLESECRSVKQWNSETSQCMDSHVLHSKSDESTRHRAENNLSVGLSACICYFPATQTWRFIDLLGSVIIWSWEPCEIERILGPYHKQYP